MSATVQRSRAHPPARALLVAAVAFMLSAAPAAWGQTIPTRIGNQLYPSDVTAHVDADGTARVGYLTGGEDGTRAVLWATAAAPGERLGPAKPLLRFGPVHQISGMGEPTFAWDDRGRAVVAWDQRVSRSRAGRSVFVALQAGNGRWSAPLRLSDASHLSRYPALAVDPAGNAIVAWETQTRAGWHVETALRRADAARFGAPAIRLTRRARRTPARGRDRCRGPGDRGVEGAALRARDSRLGRCRGRSAAGLGPLAGG